MHSVFLATLAAAIVATTCAAARAEPQPWRGIDGVQRNGAVSRYVWKPEIGTMSIGGIRLSAGVALGLHGVMQAQLDRRVTPSIGIGIGPHASLALLPAGNRGTMLVLQATP